jgi:hypothetical protein
MAWVEGTDQDVIRRIFSRIHVLIPGIGAATEARLVELLDPRVTAVTPAMIEALDMHMFTVGDPEAKRLGLHFDGGPEVSVVVTDPLRPIGSLHIQSGGTDNVLFFDNRQCGGAFYGNLRMLGSDCLVCVNDIADRYVALPDVLLRSNGQILFWGIGASAVGCSIEIEGDGHAVSIGDDALIASGVWIRNYDMHAMHDLRTGKQINRPPMDTILERHVWLAQDALLLSCARIGMGSIVGARSVLKGVVPARVVVAGQPARIIREATSWGRLSGGMTDVERESILP